MQRPARPSVKGQQSQLGLKRSVGQPQQLPYSLHTLGKLCHLQLHTGAIADADADADAAAELTGCDRQRRGCKPGMVEDSAGLFKRSSKEVFPSEWSPDWVPDAGCRASGHSTGRGCSGCIRGKGGQQAWRQPAKGSTVRYGWWARACLFVGLDACMTRQGLGQTDRRQHGSQATTAGHWSRCLHC